MELHIQLKLACSPLLQRESKEKERRLNKCEKNYIIRPNSSHFHAVDYGY